MEAIANLGPVSDAEIKAALIAKNEAAFPVGVIEQASGENWTLYNGDCCQVIAGIPSASIDYCIHSPPFSNLYIYSDSEADMGNCINDDEFFQHYEFLIQELFRVTVNGRLCSVHCKDLPKYKGRDGAAGLSDFPGKIIAAFERHGWQFHSRVTIWKDPVTEMQRTKNHGLLHKQLCKDSSASRQGMADYLVTFRKWDGDEFPKPVKGFSKDVRFGSYVGEEKFIAKGSSPAEFQRDYSIQVWQRYASPVWYDINQMRVLNNYRTGKGERDERHICPLQLDVIERCVHLWTNEGDVVLSPFAGVGSEGDGSVRMGRKFVGIELKKEYFDVAKKNLTAAEERARTRKRKLPGFDEAVEGVELAPALAELGDDADADGNDTDNNDNAELATADVDVADL